MTTLDDIIAHAKTLPGVTEGPPVRAARRAVAFKVAGKSFLGVETDGMVTLAFPEEAGLTLCEGRPETFQAIHGPQGRFMGIRLDPARLDTAEARQLAESAHRFRRDHKR